MSDRLATHTIRGANTLVTQAEQLLNRALSEHGSKAAISFPNTVYYLPTILGLTGTPVEKIDDLAPVIDRARSLLPPAAIGAQSTENAAQLLDAGMASLLAAETIEGLRFVGEAQADPVSKSTGSAKVILGSKANRSDGHTDGASGCPINDAQLCSWGAPLVDGRMPGYALLVGCASSDEVAAGIVRDLQKRGILCFLGGSVNGRSLIDQVREAGIELGYQSLAVPLGAHATSGVHALGFAARAALRFGGLKPGMSREILLYSKEWIPAFVLALGEIDDVMYAMAAGARCFGLPLIADMEIATMPSTGERAREGVGSHAFSNVGGKGDLERAAQLVQKCVEVRGLNVNAAGIDIPVHYSSAFEDEVISPDDLGLDLGDGYGRAFELVQKAALQEVTDGRIDVIGSDISTGQAGDSVALGIVVRVAGRRMRQDFEPLLERQIHRYLASARGIQHSGQRDRVGIRISRAATEKGFSLLDLGKILDARFRQDFGAIVDKLQVTLITDPGLHPEWLTRAQAAYDHRDQQQAGFTDSTVDEFYSCVRCGPIAPNHVCIVSPERPALCGAYTWLDCKSTYRIDPTGPLQPIKLGKSIDMVKGYWEGTNKRAVESSHGMVDEVSMYSMMENPMTSSGCLECIVMLVPEANGVLIAGREDACMTPAGMTSSTLTCLAGSGLQTPGVMGVARAYVVSPKFISAEGGFRRVVWMSSGLKDTMSDELKAVCRREGDPAFLDKVADERAVTAVDELLAWLRTSKHPVLAMEPMF